MIQFAYVAISAMWFQAEAIPIAWNSGVDEGSAPVVDERMPVMEKAESMEVGDRLPVRGENNQHEGSL